MKLGLRHRFGVLGSICKGHFFLINLKQMLTRICPNYTDPKILQMPPQVKGSVTSFLLSGLLHSVLQASYESPISKHISETLKEITLNNEKSDGRLRSFKRNNLYRRIRFISPK